MYVIKNDTYERIKLKIPEIRDGLEICSEGLGQFVLGGIYNRKGETLSTAHFQGLDKKCREGNRLSFPTLPHLWGRTGHSGGSVV